MAEKYDDVLLPFLSLMRKELHANAGKGDRPGWLRMDANTALLEVYYHLGKLQKAVKHNDGPAIMEYSADVANMAMMVLDICGGLAWVEAPAGAQDLPRSDSTEAIVCIEEVLAERNYPTGTNAAGRAGWEAAFRWLRADEASHAPNGGKQ